jgi:hypothetical protein
MYIQSSLLAVGNVIVNTECSLSRGHNFGFLIGDWVCGTEVPINIGVGDTVLKKYVHRPYTHISEQHTAYRSQVENLCSKVIWVLIQWFCQVGCHLKSTHCFPTLGHFCFLSIVECSSNYCILSQVKKTVVCLVYAHLKDRLSNGDWLT